MTTVIVGGAGHVGLPLGLALARENEQVIAYDIDTEALGRIKNGDMPFLEEGAEQLLREVLKDGRFLVTDQKTCLLEANVIILVLGTPVDEYLSPNPNEIVDVCKMLIPYFRSGQVLILRSTVFPNVTARIESLIKEHGLEMSVAYCPERILEGKALSEIEELPQIIGVRNPCHATQLEEYFKRISKSVLLCSPEEAELAKLFTNVWRYTKFAVSNQFWIIANELGIDFAKVHQLITHDYPRASDLPMPGLTAGPCLFKDTMQMSAILSRNFALGTTAMMINEGIPGYIIDRMKMRYSLRTTKVGILGAAFKAESDDIRGSLAFKLRKMLMFQCEQVLITDPFVQDKRIVDIEYLIENSDVLVVATPHSVYKHKVIDKPVIDVWNIRNNGVLI